MPSMINIHISHALFAAALIACLFSSPLPGSLLLPNQTHIIPKGVEFTTIEPKELESLPRDTKALKCNGINDDQAKALKHFEHLVWLDISDSPELSSAGLLHISRLNLEGVNVSRTAVGESGIKSIASIKTLRHLDAQGQFTWTSAAVASLVSLSQLESLGVTWRQPLVKDLLRLNKLTKLKTLRFGTDLDTTPLEDLNLRLLDLPNLSWLDLSQCTGLTSETLVNILSDKHHLSTLILDWCTQISDSVIDAIPDEAPIQRLGLCDCRKLTDLALSRIVRFTTICDLDLYISSEAEEERPLSTDALGTLGKLTSLRRLSLSNRSGLEDKALAAISKAGSLMELHIAGCRNISDGGISELSKLSALQLINLSGCVEVGDRGIEKIATRNNLTRIYLSGCTKITSRSLLAMANCPIIELTLDNCIKVSTNGLMALLNCKQITSLSLAGIPAADDAFIAELGNLTSLKSLVLSRTAVSDTGLASLADLSKLTTLVLSGCQKISDEGVTTLAQLSTLRYLSLERCPLVTHECVKWLRDKLPKCHIEF